MLPNFLVIGAIKAGTTSLYHYLRAHPEVFMPRDKELDFFTAEFNWRLGQSWYEQQFEDTGTASAIGEASPRYAAYPVYGGVPGRIAKVLPDARLIYVVRHPVERMRSHYLHLALYRKEQQPIEKALLSVPIYLAASRYALQVEQYLEYFRREQILVLTSEQLRDLRADTLHKVYEFLGVDPTWTDGNHDREYNESNTKRIPRRFAPPVTRLLWVSRHTPDSVKRPLGKLYRRLGMRGVQPNRASFSEEFRYQLEELLRDDIRRLRSYMGKDFDGWGLA